MNGFIQQTEGAKVRQFVVENVNWIRICSVGKQFETSYNESLLTISANRRFPVNETGRLLDLTH